MRYTKALCRTICCISIVATAAHASLPPLPEQMPPDDALEPQGVPPLPHGAGGEVFNPFRAEAAEDAGASADASTTAVSSDAPGDQPASTSVSAGDGSGNPLPRADSMAGQALEGPPVPLPPAQRLGGPPENGQGEGPDASKPLTLTFQHAELGAVLNAFARFTGLNIVASERARGFVSLRLDKVPWRTAFDTLLEANGLAMERRGNVIWVAPLAELAVREKQRFEAHVRAADLEPLASRTFELHYAHAEDVRKLLTASGAQRVLSKRGAAMADSRTNLLFVTDLDARLAQISALLASIDRPARQVLIEARIVEGDQGFSRNLGVRLSMNGTSSDGASQGVVGGSDGAVYDLSARPIAGFDAATAGLTLFAAHATRLLNIERSALEQEGRGQIVSSPRVVTADRMKAIVEQGTELP